MQKQLILLIENSKQVSHFEYNCGYKNPEHGLGLDSRDNLVMWRSEGVAFKISVQLISHENLILDFTWHTLNISEGEELLRAIHRKTQ